MALIQWTSRAASHNAFAAEELTPEKLLPGGAKLDPTIVPVPDAETLTAKSAVASAGAATITLENPLLSTIPIGTVLVFDGDNFTLTKQAMAGSKTLVGTAAAAIAIDDTAAYAGRRRDRPFEAGQLVGRTFAERTAGTAFGVADVATPDDEIYLTAFDVQDATIHNDVTLLRHGTLIYEDKLPGWAGLSAGAKAWIRANYQCITSVEAA